MKQQTSQTRLAAAKAAHDSIAASMDRINVDLTRIENAAIAVEQQVRVASSLKQERKGIFSRMLRLGKVDPHTDEVARLDQQIANHVGAIDHAVDIAAAKTELQAELQNELRELQKQLPIARRELLLAQFEAAGNEIKRQALPEFIAACEALGEAYATLAGAGAAHQTLATELREKFNESVSPVGSMYPLATLHIPATGFGFGFDIDRQGPMNTKLVDCTARIQTAKADALARWRIA